MVGSGEAGLRARVSARDRGEPDPGHPRPDAAAHEGRLPDRVVEADRVRVGSEQRVVGLVADPVVLAEADRASVDLDDPEGYRRLAVDVGPVVLGHPLGRRLAVDGVPPVHVLGVEPADQVRQVAAGHRPQRDHRHRVGGELLHLTGEIHRVRRAPGDPRRRRSPALPRARHTTEAMCPGVDCDRREHDLRLTPMSQWAWPPRRSTSGGWDDQGKSIQRSVFL